MAKKNRKNNGQQSKQSSARKNNSPQKKQNPVSGHNIQAAIDKYRKENKQYFDNFDWSSISKEELRNWQQGLETKFNLPKGLGQHVPIDLQVYNNRAEILKQGKDRLRLNILSRVSNNKRNNTGIHNEPRKTSLDRVIANRGPFTFNPNPINGIGVRSPLPKIKEHHGPLRPGGEDLWLRGYHLPPEVKLDSKTVNPNAAAIKLDPGGSHLTREEINKDVTDSIEKRTEERRKLPFIKSLFASKTDANADRLTAAYNGFKTDVEPKTKIFNRQMVSYKNNKTPFQFQKTTPPGYNPLSPPKQLLPYNSAELPKQLKGVGNLDNETDLFKFRAAYDQDLMNDRLGKRANYVNLTNEDIFQSSIRNTDIGNGGMLNAATMNAADTGYGMKQHLLHSGTLSAANPRSLKYGYGMGWGNAWRATRAEHLYRATAVINPLSRGNLSTMGEMLGRVSTRDRLNFAANPSLMNRFMNVIQPAAVTGLLGYGMIQMQDPGELLTNFAAPAAAIYGGRVGLAMGAMITPAKTAANWGLLRGAGMALGSALGFTAGLTAASLVGMGLSSATSNDSSIRKFANSLNKTEIYTPQFDNRQTLTARQQALHKLSKSGLNDRALLLGNEASALRGLI